MPFIDRKDSGIISQVLTVILDECLNGITLADPDQEDCPIVYANQAFERLTGYSQHDIVGRNCRFLQGQDRDQEGCFQIKEAMQKNERVDVVLRNYKKDGKLFHNHLKIIPLFDSKGRILYYLGLQHDISYRINAQAEINKLSSRLKD